jgi:hypothetical protein
VRGDKRRGERMERCRGGERGWKDAEEERVMVGEVEN